MDTGAGASTWQVTGPVGVVSGDARGSLIDRSPHARAERRARRSSSAGRVAVLRLRRTRPCHRGSLRRPHRLVLRDQRTRRPGLRPPLARRTEPRRHHHHRLERRATGGHTLRRIPLPRRIHRREDGRPETWHSLRPLGAHGGSDRCAATRVGRDRERSWVALRARDPRQPRRRRR